MRIEDGEMPNEPLRAVHNASGGRGYETVVSLGSTFWRSAGLNARKQAYRAIVPPGLHLACGLARLRTRADGLGGFSADGPAISALQCLEPTAFASELEPGETLSCGLWLTRDQLATAKGAFGDLAATLGDRPILRASTAIPARIVARLCTPIDPWFEGAARALVADARALELIAAVMTWAMRTPPAKPEPMPRRHILAARDLIESRLASPPTLAEIATAVGLNERSLTAAFRTAFGVSIAAYVTARRLDLAAACLSRGATAGEAARMVGYRPTHLAVAFKRRFGISPSAYRG